MCTKTSLFNFFAGYSSELTTMKDSIFVLFIVYLFVFNLFINYNFMFKSAYFSNSFLAYNLVFNHYWRASEEYQIEAYIATSEGRPTAHCVNNSFRFGGLEKILSV